MLHPGMRDADERLKPRVSASPPAPLLSGQSAHRNRLGPDARDASSRALAHRLLLFLFARDARRSVAASFGAGKEPQMPTPVRRPGSTIGFNNPRRAPDQGHRRVSRDAWLEPDRAAGTEALALGRTDVPPIVDDAGRPGVPERHPTSCLCEKRVGVSAGRQRPPLRGES